MFICVFVELLEHGCTRVVGDLTSFTADQGSAVYLVGFEYIYIFFVCFCCEEQLYGVNYV